MFARLVKANIKAGQAAQFNQKFEQEILPMFRKAKGFRNAMTFIAGSTEGISLSLWDLKEDAEAYNTTTYPEVLKALSGVLDGSPQVKIYDVTFSTFEKLAAHAV